MEIATNFLFLGSKITADDDCSHEVKRLFLLGRKAMTNIGIILKNRDITQLNYSQNYGFSSSHEQMWELDHKEGWAPKNWCFRTAVLENTLENLLDCKEIKPSNPKGNLPWIFTETTDAEAEAPILWPPDAKSREWRTGKSGVFPVHGVTKSQTLLSNWTIITSFFHPCSFIHYQSNFYDDVTLPLQTEISLSLIKRNIRSTLFFPSGWN